MQPVPRAPTSARVSQVRAATAQRLDLDTDALRDAETKRERFPLLENVPFCPLAKRCFLPLF